MFPTRCVVQKRVQRCGETTNVMALSDILSPTHHRHPAKDKRRKGREPCTARKHWLEHAAYIYTSWVVVPGRWPESKQFIYNDESKVCRCLAPDQVGCISKPWSCMNGIWLKITGTKFALRKKGWSRSEAKISRRKKHPDLLDKETYQSRHGEWRRRTTSASSVSPRQSRRV